MLGCAIIGWQVATASQYCMKDRPLPELRWGVERFFAWRDVSWTLGALQAYMRPVTIEGPNR